MTKPFNLADAKAGHPVQTVGGAVAVIFKFDARNASAYHHFGTVELGNEEIPEQWNDAGKPWGTRNNNLVMAPIGTIDGKPVYPGDMTTVYDTPCQAWHTEPIDWASAKWPRQYPETQMDGEALRSVYMMTDAVGDHDDHKAVANAAIRHGIANGYLLDPREPQAISIKLPEMSQEELGRLMSDDRKHVGELQVLPTDVTALDAMTADRNHHRDARNEICRILVQVARIIGIGNKFNWADVPDAVRSRERAIMRAGINWAFDVCGTPPHRHAETIDFIDELIAKAK